MTIDELKADRDLAETWDEEAELGEDYIREVLDTYGRPVDHETVREVRNAWAVLVLASAHL